MRARLANTFTGKLLGGGHVVQLVLTEPLTT